MELVIPSSRLLFSSYVLPDHRFNTNECYMLHILLMTARKPISINCMRRNPHTTVQWLQTVKHVCVRESKKAQLRLKLFASVIGYHGYTHFYYFGV